MSNGRWFPALAGVQDNVIDWRVISLIVPFLFLGRGTIFVSQRLALTLMNYSSQVSYHRVHVV